MVIYVLIKDKMTKNIITISVHNNIYELAKLMKEYDVGFIPVTNNNQIIGIITDRDIVVKPLSNRDNDIKDYISSNIISIDENKNTIDALKLMKKYKIKRLIVTSNKKVTGIISLSDILNDIDSNQLKNALLEIYEIDKNNHDFNSDVDSFYL